MRPAAIEAFQNVVWAYYEAHGRHDLPWRIPEPDGSFDPHKVLVSEIMLQQTQVARVMPKYQNLIYRFPTVELLAAAPLREVLKEWNGLGYNRRAKFLHQAAQVVVRDFGGNFPEDIQELVKLPGVGKNTAGAVLAYAFNKPVSFIETNIRTVYIHHFFKDQADIPDTAIVELATQTLDRQNPRVWYWALMDYGTYLKRTVENLNKLSKHYNRQTPFEGSRRQVRGKVLRLLASGPLTTHALRDSIADERLDDVLRGLSSEGLIRRSGDSYRLGT